MHVRNLGRKGIEEIMTKLAGLSTASGIEPLTSEEKIQDFCETAGNGRFCRNLTESAILNYAARVYGDDIPEEKPDFTLACEDFTLPESLKNIRKPAVLGFKAS